MSRISSPFPSALIVVVLAAMTLSACGGGGATSAQGLYGGSGTVRQAGLSAASGPASLRAGSSSLGRILVDAQGRTLYLFKADRGARSACRGGCASAWPPLRTSGKPGVGNGVDPAKVGTAPRSDGKVQVTYNGHPLYSYVGDSKPGDVTGQGLTAFGATWFAVSPAGNQVSKHP